MADALQVLSAESRIQMTEALVNTTIWSNHSLVRFELAEAAESKDKGLVSISASDSISIDLNINGAHLQVISTKIH